MEKNRAEKAAPWITRRLRVGLAWLWENRRQRKGAMIESHGIFSDAGEFHLSIYPIDPNDLPVVTVEAEYRWLEHGRPEGYLTGEDVRIFRGLIERVAWKVGAAMVLEIWNGVGCGSVSFKLSRRCGRGPRGLIEAYEKGCSKPGHQTACAWDGCTWLADGYKKARLPKGWR